MSGESNLIVAIDGPAASGKSTVARRLAGELGLVFVSSGAMYRAFTWRVVQGGIDPADTGAVIELLATTTFRCEEHDGAAVVEMDGRPMTAGELSAPEVNRNVSAVSAIPEVRERLVAEQRAYARRIGVVMEGRDIGSVVFPDTPHKFYIDASPEVREQRRRAEGVEDTVAERDKLDSSRKASPLLVAEDATVVDSSELSVDEVVKRIVEAIQAGG